MLQLYPGNLSIMKPFIYNVTTGESVGEPKERMSIRHSHMFYLEEAKGTLDYQGYIDFPGEIVKVTYFSFNT
ncbi:BnaC08g10930D [Brassica napus]|uniref:BnaC08g10930D protein n=2 Tax=Brassica TaxID=3705 RepID=A0A078HY63_BRANA|nr:BnaC08g10930D [Brassica napus]